MSAPLRARPSSRPATYSTTRRSASPSATPSPPPRQKRRHRSRHRGNAAYSQPSGRRHSKPGSRARRPEVRFLLCVFHSSSHTWSTEPLRFDPGRINDRELWEEIRRVFRDDLQKRWRRVLGIKRVKGIVPIGYTSNGVPTRTDPKDFPDSKAFTHAYHHPEQIRPDHKWVDRFSDFDRADPSETNGLEFVEGLWAEKLAIIAVAATVAIVVTSIVWCVLGGNLQTVFTVMGFVLSLIAAQIALAALYYQVALPG